MSSYKDFGQGFYLTVLKDQAEKMVTRVSRIHGGSPVINVYELNESAITASELKVKDFMDTTSPAWAKFVKNNRDRRFFEISSPDCYLDNKYDIVIGPITDDNMALLLSSV